MLSAVLDEFGRHRLLTFDRDAVSGDATVEVAHEALLTEWDRLALWVEQHRTDLRRHAALAAAVEDWLSADRDPDYLLGGGRLAEVEGWAQSTTLDLATTEREFIDASLQRRAAMQEDEEARRQGQRRLEKRARIRLVALAATVALLAGAVTYGVLAWPGDDAPPDAVVLAGAPIAFTEMLKRGYEDAVADLGIDGEMVIPGDDEPSAAEITAAAESGTDLVVALTGDCPGVDQIARGDPQTSFVLFDCQGEVPNVAYLNFAAEQGSFLAGAAAALKTQTGVVGFIGGADFPRSGPSNPDSRQGRAPSIPTSRCRPDT